MKKEYCYPRFDKYRCTDFSRLHKRDHIGGYDMTKERNIKLYYAAYRYLEQIKPEGVRLEDYFYGDNRDYTSLKEVYISVCED